MRFQLKLLFALVALILVPLTTDRIAAARMARYNALAAHYECNLPECVADFNGDGVAGMVTFDSQHTPPPESYPGWHRWLLVVDAGNELLRIPFRYADGSLRTHAAIRPAAGGARLIVFDHDKGGVPIRQVFAWNGRLMVEVTPTQEDLNILSALAATDDAGTARLWALYRALRIGALLLYCTLVLCFGLYILFKHKDGSNIKRQAF